MMKIIVSDSRKYYILLIILVFSILFFIAPSSWQYDDVKYFIEWYDTALEYGILQVYRFASKVAYPPLSVLFFISFYGIALSFNNDNILFIRLITKIPLIVSFFAILHIIYRNKGFKGALLWSMCYAGYGVLISYQFDLITGLFLLLSYLYIVRDKPVYSAIAFSIAVLTKQMVVLLAPIYIIYFIKKGLKDSVKKFIVTSILVLVIIILPFFLVDPIKFIDKVILFHANRLPQALSLYTIPLYITDYRYWLIPSFITYIWLPIFLVFYIMEIYLSYHLDYSINGDKKLLYMITLVLISMVFLNKVGNPQYYLWFAPFIPLIAINNNGRDDRLLYYSYIMAPIFSMVIYTIVFKYSAAVVSGFLFVPEDMAYIDAYRMFINSIKGNPYNIALTVLVYHQDNFYTLFYTIYHVHSLILVGLTLTYNSLLILMAYRLFKVYLHSNKNLL